MTSTKSKKKQIISPYQVLSWVHYLQELIMFVFFFMINLPKSQFKVRAKHPYRNEKSLFDWKIEGLGGLSKGGGSLNR